MNNFKNDDDQEIYAFNFILTPLEIISPQSNKNLKKSILIKLGSKTEKTSQLNKPISMEVDVLYSKTLKKYCPVKGIIKIYDINIDGSEVISSVGGFQTEQLLNEDKKNMIIERDVGNSKLKMKIQIKNQKNLFKREEETNNSVRQSPQKNYQTQKIGQTKIQPYFSRQSGSKTQQKEKSAGFSRKTSETSNLSNSKIEITNENDKVRQLTSQNQEFLLNCCQKLVDGLQYRLGKPILQFNQAQKMLSIKCKNINFDKTFIEFASIINNQIREKTSNSSSSPKKRQINSKGIENKQQQTQLNELNEEIKRKNTQILNLRNKQRQKSSLQIKVKAKQHQIGQLQNKIVDLETFHKSLQEQINYLKSQNQTLQQLLNEKQNNVQELKQQLIEFQLSYKQLQARVKNSQCQIEQLRQQTSNLNQIIESYRQKYGDLKSVKNRALQNQLKQCLMWIDQQTRQFEINDMLQDNTQPSHSHNVSDILKSIELEGTSRQEMNEIKNELSGLIRRIDNFLMK